MISTEVLIARSILERWYSIGFMSMVSVNNTVLAQILASTSTSPPTLFVVVVNNCVMEWGNVYKVLAQCREQNKCSVNVSDDLEYQQCALPGSSTERHVPF